MSRKYLIPYIMLSQGEVAFNPSDIVWGLKYNSPDAIAECPDL